MFQVSLKEQQQDGLVGTENFRWRAKFQEVWIKMTGAMKKWIIGKCAGIVCILLLFPASFCFSQITGSGDIRGSVTDSTGAQIPGAAVVVLNLDTGVSKNYTTDDGGVYDTSSIVIGNYSLTFSKSGFKQFVRGPITVQGGFTTVNAQLTVGSEQQQVIVQDNVPLLQTESMEQSLTLQADVLQQLPQVGQDWQNFIVTAPGVTGAASANGAQPASNPSQYGSVNGNLPYANVTLDGSTVTLVNSSNSTVPPMETIAEVQMQTSTFTAQSGIGGTQYNQITKGGTSHFHGVAYEYFQNDALNAANYGFGNDVSVPYLRYNNYGGSVGGPILKKKMFFYFNFDKTSSNSGASVGYATLPSAAVMTGDFTGFPTIYDPTTQIVTQTGTVTQPDGTVQTCPCVTRKSFAEEYGNGNRIPSSMLNQVALNTQALYPTQANHPSTGKFVPGTLQPDGTVVNNYYYSLPSSAPQLKYFGRLDYDFRSNNRITISDSQQDAPAVGPTFFASPIGWQPYDVENNNAQISDVWTISPTLMNEFRYGFTAQLNYFADDTLGKGYPSQLGVQFAKADSLPNFSIGGYNGIGPASNAILKQFTYAPSDVVTLILGKHILHFGGQFLMYINNATSWGNINSSSFNFGGGYTQEYVGSANTGVGYADFLLGDSSSWYAQVTPEYGARYKTPQMFIQDDYKVSPNLTVNLGIRYTIQHGWNEVKGNMSSFDPAVLNPATNTLGAMWYGTTHANGRTSLEADIWSSVLPRVGFAWQFEPNTTVRGGYGIYDFNYSLGVRGVGMGGVFQSYGSVTDLTNGITPALNLSSSGSDLPYSGSSTAADALNGESPTYMAYHAPDMKIEQWTLAVQRMLGTNLVAELAYVGSHGFNLPFPVDINQVPAGKLDPNDNPTGRPYPQFQGFYTQSGTNNAISNYNALQASLSRRLTSGLAFNVNYVWSHFLDTIDTSAWYNGNQGSQSYQNSYDPAANYGPSNFDVRNAFKGTATYQLPFGVGRKYLNHGSGLNNRFIDGVVGGWNLAGIVRVQSGNPFTPVISVNNSYAQAGEWFPNVVGRARLSHPSITTGWFNPEAFASPLNATFGNARRNSVYGPMLSKFDLSLGKIFSLTEQIKLEIRGDASNVLNHPSFGDPNYYLYCPTPGGTCSSSNVTNVSSVTVGGRTMQLGARLSF